MINKNSIIPLRHILIMLGFAALLMAPAVLLGSGGIDMHYQSLLTREFSAQFWHGDLYPRWLSNMFAGNGSPIFFYYPPLTYFITAFFMWLRPLDVFGYTPIAASAFLAVALSGGAFYLWMREETDSREAALLGSLLYMAAPNHVAQNFYYILLFSSVWSYVWIPLLLLFAKRLAFGKPYAVAGFAAALFLLVMTNLPMTLMCGPIAVAYSMLFFRKDAVKRQAMRLAGGLILGFGLSAVYLLPMFSYMDFVTLDFHWNVPGVKYENFIRGIFFFNFDYLYCNLYKAYFAGALILTAAYCKYAGRSPVQWFFCLVSAAALCMMLPASKLIWEYISILKILQFAERLWVVPSLCLAVLAAYTLPRLRLLAYVLLALYILVTIAVAAGTRMTLEDYRVQNPEGYANYQLNIEQYATYLTTPDLYTRYYTMEGLLEIKAHPEQIQLMKGDAALEIKSWHPRNILLHFKATNPSKVRIRQFDFPGFRAFFEGKELEITRDGHTGDILLDIPPAEGDIEVKLMPLLPEIAGKMLSILCLAIISLLFLLEMKKHTQTREILKNIPKGWH